MHQQVHIKKIGLLLGLLVVLANEGWAQPLRMLADTWTPYTDKEGASPGFIVEVAAIAAKRAGYEVSYKMVPWTRAVTEVKRGEAELLLAVLPSQVEKEGLILCAEPFAFDHNLFFTLRDSLWQYSGLKSLEGQRLGVVQDYQYGEALDRYIVTHGNDEARVSFSLGDIPIQTSLKKLVAGRVTVIVEDPNVLHWNARQLGLDDKLRYAGAADVPVGIFMAVSPKMPDAARVAAKIAAALREFKGTAEYAKIREKYMIVEPTSPTD